MAEYTSLKQSNTGWNLTWSALGRYPMVAKRRFPTLADAQAFVDDVAPGASATEGLIVTVLNDSTPKNNGVWYVKSVANNDAAYGAIAAKGELIKVGGTETETAKNYSAAVELSKTLTVGQLIKVSEQETITTGEGESAVTNTYKAGFYIVEGSGVISALDTSTGAADEIGALKTRVSALETDRVKVSDFDTYKAGVTASLDSKAAASDFASHATAGVDSADKALHVTLEDKTKWNNAETNARQFASDEIAKLSTVYDAKGAADDALGAAKEYTDAEIVKANAYADQAEADANKYADDAIAALKVSETYETKSDASSKLAEAKKHADDAIVALKVSETYETKSDASSKLAEAKKHADDEIAAAVGAYTAEGVEASGLRKEIEDKVAAAETAAKKHADDEIAAAVGAYTAEGVEASGLRKEIEDKVAAVADAAKTYSISKITEGLSENVKEAYKLVDEDGVQAGETINIYKDSALKSVSLEGQELVFIYILANGEESDPVKVDVSAFLHESEYGDGLQVIDHIVSVKRDSESEAFLSVSANGVKLSGVQTAIDNAKDAAIEAANDYTDEREVEIDKKWAAADEATLNSAKAYADQAELDAIAAAKTETETQVAALANGAVKANADAIKIINNPDASVEGSIAKAKADAIAAALAKIAELDVANVYETKSDASAKLEAAKAYTDEREVEIDKKWAAADATNLEAAKAYTDEVAGVYSSEGVEASGLRKEIEDNEKVTSAALNDLDGRVADLEAHKDDYKAYADQAETDAIAAANAYSTAYTDTLFESIKFASETDIDGLFTKVEA